MAAKRLYEFSVVSTQKDKEEVVVEPGTVMAVSEDNAKVIALRKVPADFPEEDLQYLDVIVRPFGAR